MTALKKDCLTLEDLPASLRRFTTGSMIVSHRAVIRSTGISERRHYMVMNDETEYTEKELDAVSKFFGVTPEFFLKALVLIREWKRNKKTGELPRTPIIRRIRSEMKPVQKPAMRPRRGKPQAPPSTASPPHSTP